MKLNLSRYLFPLLNSNRDANIWRDGLAQCSLGTFGITAAGIATAASVAGAGASIYGAINSADASRKSINAQKDALKAQQDIISNLKYEPINIASLQKAATEQAISNATQSLALERELSPDVAASRQMVAQQVRQDLALGGRLSPDTANQIARASRTAGAMSGAPAGPITAAQIGLTSEQLHQARLAEGTNLLNQNQLPVAGLNPGSLASLMVSQNNAQNSFNAAKAGINSNLAQSTGQVNAGIAAQQGAATSGLLTSILGPQNANSGGILGQLAGLFPSTGGAPSPTSYNTPTKGYNLLGTPSFLSNPSPTNAYNLLGTPSFLSNPSAFSNFSMPAIPASVQPTPFAYSLN